MIEYLLLCFIMTNMIRQLSDQDIANMIGEDFIPDDKNTKKSVRSELHLSTRIPKPNTVKENTIIDFHQHTEQESWDMLIHIAASGIKNATVITGASGILKIKFQQWATESILAPYIESFSPINNGSFKVKFHKQKTSL